MALAAFGGYAQFFELEVVTDRRRLSNQSLEFNRRVERYREEFGDENILVTVVSAGPPEGAIDPPGRDERDAMKAVARDYAEKLRARPDLFVRVFERIEWEEMGPFALLYLPTAQVERLAKALTEADEMLARFAGDPSLQNLFATLREEFERLTKEPPGERARASLGGALTSLEEFFRWLRHELTARDGESAGIEALEDRILGSIGSAEFDLDGYLFANEGRILTISAAVSDDPTKRNRYAEVIRVARDALEEALRENVGDTGVDAGLAGLPAVEYEETIVSQRDFIRGTSIALVLVSALFMWAFGGLLRPLLAAFCLCISIGITFGFAWIAIGHLNLIAMVFAIILVALGIDFAIHFTTHYETCLRHGHGSRHALEATYDRISGALWMGGLTTAAAFFSAWFTESTGLSELGVIAGGGLLICLMCMFFVYPALLFLVDRRRPHPPGHAHGPFIPRPTDADTLRRPPGFLGRVALGSAAVLAAGGFVFGQYDFDTNLLDLQPTHGDASQWQRVLLEGDDRTRFAIATYDDRGTLEDVRRQLEASPFVRRTDSLFPKEAERKRRLLAGACTELEKVEFAAPGEPSPLGVRRELFAMRQLIRRLIDQGGEQAAPLGGLDAEIDASYRALRQVPGEKSAPRLERIQSELTAVIRDRVEDLMMWSCPPPFRAEIAPPPIRDRTLGKSGTYALYIYPTENTWDAENLEDFVESVREVEPDVFGGVVSYYENARSMVRSFGRASVYSLLAIVTMVLLWSRSVRATVLALFPLATAVGLLLGLMRHGPLPVSWNFANFFALPILIGIGVAAGIHIVRAFQEDGAEALRCSIRAVFLSSATTVIGFGILATSQHLGIRSLGWILFLGILLILIVSVTLLPAALRLVPHWTAGSFKRQV